MGTALTGLGVGSTYNGLLKTTDNAVLDGALRVITDGFGNESALQISTAGVASSGTLSVTGASTMAALSATTGAFSSTLSVAGAISGAGFTALFASPPAIGGTTPAAGAFTTLSATGTISLGNASTISWGGAYGAGTPAIIGSTGAGELQFRPTGSTSGTIATVSATGLAVTGALSATGTSSATTGSFANVTASSSLTVGTGAGASTRTLVLNGGSNTNTGSYVDFQQSSGSSSKIGVDGPITGNSVSDLALWANTTKNINFYVNGSFTPVGQFNTSGLAVSGTGTFAGSTGAVSVSSSVGTQQAYLALTNTGGTYYVGANNSTGSAFGGTAYSLVRYVPAGKVIQDIIAGTGVVTTISATGLAVTGLTTTDALRINTAPFASVATPSTHKVAVNLNGATYYLLATT